MLEIPQDPSRLTADWLTAALSSRVPGVVVTEVRQDRIVHGAATKVRLQLSYQDNGYAAGMPSTVWAKSGWEPHGAWLDNTTGISAREARFYQEFADVARVNAPKCYFAAWEASGRGIVLLEDLDARSIRFGGCCVEEKVSQVALMLENLARLHARWWNAPGAARLAGLDAPMRRDTPSSEWPRGNGPEVIERYLATARGRDVPAKIKSPMRIDNAFWAMIDHMKTEAPACVLHGDAHPGNSFFSAEGYPGLYDWQTLSFGPWAHDVTYYMVSALGIADRRSADRQLLQHYIDALRTHGIDEPPDFDTAWLAHRRYLAYGLHIWITNPIEFQSEENCTAMVTRFAAAAEDYNFFEAWEV